MLKNRAALLVIIVLSTFFETIAQMPGTGGAAKRTDKNFQFLPLPYVNYSRSLEFSYGVMPMAMYNLNKNDTISPSSVSGGLYMRTTNGTWFGMGFSKFYLKQDQWRIMVAGGSGNVNFQFYPDLPFLPEVVDYSTGADFIMSTVERRVAENMYVGLGYSWINMATAFDIEGVPTQYVTLNGINLSYSIDKRDDVYYPHKGYITNARFNLFPEWMGNQASSNKLELDFNQYFEMPNERDVVAARAFVGIGLGELDFNQQFIVGKTDLRGYSQGEYRGEQLYALQGEYRWNITEKFGLVGFAGVATLTNATNEDHNGKLLPAGGGGFRINVFPQNHMNIGLDAGVGQGDWGIEFRIGEAF